MDIVFCMDVIEHLEEPYQLFRSLREKTLYLIIHLPLEQSICHLLLKKPSTSYINLGHLHFFSWETANILIKHSSFEIVDYQFTSPAISLKILSKDIKKFYHLFRYSVYKINPSLAAILFGGSVMLLLKNNSFS